MNLLADSRGAAATARRTLKRWGLISETPVLDGIRLVDFEYSLTERGHSAAERWAKR